MYGLIVGALGRRRGQALLLLLLAFVAALGAAAAPGYIHATVEQLAGAAGANASTQANVVAAATTVDADSDLARQLNAFTDKVSGQLHLVGFTQVNGVHVVGTFANHEGRLDYRPGVCQHLVIEGACPEKSREVVVDRAYATELGLKLGDPLPVRASGLNDPVPLRVVGISTPANANDSYWGRPEARTGSAPVGERGGDTVVFTPIATFTDIGIDRLNLTVDFIGNREAFELTDPQVLAYDSAVGSQTLTAQRIAIGSGLGDLATRIFYDQQLVYTGVVIGVAELLLVSWFALYLAMTNTATERRMDVALLKMRGARRRDQWLLLAGQSLIPLAIGAAGGWLLGPLLARWAVGAVQEPTVAARAATEAAVATAIALLGALVVALIAQWRMLSQPVSALGRGVSSIRGGWRTRTVDAVVVILAAAGAYQIEAGSGGGQIRGLELLSPLLIALALGLVVARAVPLVADRIGRSSLRAGRLGTGLAGMHLARRSGQAGVLTLLVLVAAGLTGTAVSWSISDQARRDRAAVEVGADRVLSVRDRSPEHLLAAVRNADPTGDQAMAVAVVEGLFGRVLAVDTPRLASVVRWLPGFGLPEWPEVAAALRPKPVDTVAVAGADLVADATWTLGPADGGAAPPQDDSVWLTAAIADAAGTQTRLDLGPLQPGQQRVKAALPSSCADGCRLVSLGLRSADPFYRPGSVLTLHKLDGLDDQTRLHDRTQWRASVQQGAQAPAIGASSEGLQIRIETYTSASPQQLGVAVYPVDAVTPVPVIRTPPTSAAPVVTDPRIDLLDRTSQPIQSVGTAAVLPRVGLGTLVDLEYAVRVAAAPIRADLQVWLAPGASPEVISKLTDQGVVIVSEQTIGERLDALDAQGTSLALAFLLLVGVICVVLAAVSLAVAASAERRVRGAELAALRRQGLRQRAVRWAVIGSYAVLVGVGVLGGAVTAAALAAWVPPSLPVFGDGWSSLAIPAAAGYAVPAAAGFVLAVLIVVISASSTSLLTTVRRGGNA